MGPDLASQPHVPPKLRNGHPHCCVRVGFSSRTHGYFRNGHVDGRLTLPVYRPGGTYEALGGSGSRGRAHPVATGRVAVHSPGWLVGSGGLAEWPSLRRLAQPRRALELRRRSSGGRGGRGAAAGGEEEDQQRRGGGGPAAGADGSDDKSLEVMRKFSEQYARRSNTYFCTDKTVTAVVIKGLADHRDTLGAPLCPCRHYDDKAAEVAQGFWNCPCVPMRERKECHCMLFLTPDNDFAGQDQACPFCTLHRILSSYPLISSSMTSLAQILGLIPLVYLWQVISLEEIKEATSKF
nr:unnamed protein product [Digitaria exilis]